MMEPEGALLIGWIRGFWLKPRPELALATGPVDWPEIIRLAASNRVDGLLYHLLCGQRAQVPVPDPTRRALEQAYQRRFLHASVLAERMTQILQALGSAGIPAIPLRGPALGALLYSEMALRPASDLDLLIKPTDLPLAKRVLSAMGFAKPSRALPDRYYERNHLHLQYSEPATSISVELHWALDHKYTLFTIDYDGIFERSRKADLLGARALLMCPEDWLLSLAIHLVKHCPWLGHAVTWGKGDEYLLGEGALLWLCDVAAATGKWLPELDWPALSARSREWGSASHLAWSLKAASMLLGSPPPPADLEGPSSSRVSVWFFDRAARSRAPRFLGDLNRRLLFRPIRLLDLAAFLFPDRGYLIRRYGHGGHLTVLTCRARHLTSGLFAGLVNLADVIRYSVLQALRRSA